jgi:rhodanese-related sulfurtransferase
LANTIPGHTISVQDSKNILDTDKTAVFIDVRDKASYDTNHIPGAILIPNVQISASLSKIPIDKEIVIYSQCHCPTDTIAASAVQTLMDNGYSNVEEIEGGFTAWTQAGYSVATNLNLPDSLFTKITGSFNLVPNVTNGTPLATGSVITHWANGITEITGPDNKRVMLVRDSDAPTQTVSSGEKPVTWIYSLPSGTTVATNTDPGVTKFVLNTQVILTVINSADSFTNN